MFKFGDRSKSRLRGVHPDLIVIFYDALRNSDVDFTIIEGVRTKNRQRELVNSGASTTMNSRHLTGHAVDIAPWVDGTVRWDWPLFHRIAPHVFRAAEARDIPIEWGGNWKTFPDGPHWQLPWSVR